MEIVRLEETQIEAAAATLARAFQPDPLARHMIPDDEERSLSLPHHFRAFVRLGHLFGEVQVTQGDPVGVAVWFGPEQPEPSPEQLEQAGVLRLEHELPPRSFARFVALNDHLRPLHQRDAPGRHFYLAILGVDPAWQGRRCGRALLESLLQRADDASLPCYLETAARVNLPFYLRHGFEVVVEDVEPSSGLRYWTFLRAPGAGRTAAPGGSRRRSRG